MIKTKELKILSSFFGIGLVFVLAATIWSYFALKDARQPLILHFNNLVGITQIGGVNSLVGAGITSIVVIAVNFVVTMELIKRDRFLGWSVATSTIFLAVLIFMSFAAIIGVN